MLKLSGTWRLPFGWPDRLWKVRECKREEEKPWLQTRQGQPIRFKTMIPHDSSNFRKDEVHKPIAHIAPGFCRWISAWTKFWVCAHLSVRWPTVELLAQMICMIFSPSSFRSTTSMTPLCRICWTKPCPVDISKVAPSHPEPKAMRPFRRNRLRHKRKRPKLIDEHPGWEHSFFLSWLLNSRIFSYLWYHLVMLQLYT